MLRFNFILTKRTRPSQRVKREYLLSLPAQRKMMFCIFLTVLFNGRTPQLFPSHSLPFRQRIGTLWEYNSGDSTVSRPPESPNCAPHAQNRPRFPRSNLIVLRLLLVWNRCTVFLGATNTGVEQSPSSPKCTTFTFLILPFRQ